MAIEGPRAIRREELRSGHELQGVVFGASVPPPDWEPPQMSQQQLDRQRVFVDDGKVVSTVIKPENDVDLLGARHRVCCFGGVGTLPEYRGNGLATRLLQDAKRQALANGCDLVLISGGRGLYLRQGYADVGGYHLITIERKRLPADAGNGLRPGRDEDVPALSAAYAAERVRWVRTPQMMRGGIRRRTLVVVPGETLIVVRPDTDEPLGHLGYQVGGPRWRPKPADLVTVVEIGGPRWALVQGLHRLMEQRGIDSVQFKCLSCDAEMLELARSHRWPMEPCGFYGTVGIIDPATFWERRRSMIAERLGADLAGRLRLVDGDPVRIELDDESVELADMTAVTELVFLPAHRRGELELGLADGSPLAAALGRIFPVPLVDYGYNHA